MGMDERVSSKLCGIYMIEAPDGKKYIGASGDIVKRWRTYRAQRERVANHAKLCASFREFGIDRHVFSVVELCDKAMLPEREAYHGMVNDVLESGLNSSLPKSALGNATTSKSKCENHSKALLGKRHSEAHKAAISASRTGGTLSEATKQKISKANTGRKLTDEQKQKISKAMKGRPGRPQSEETKRKIAAFQQARKAESQDKLKSYG
jgi:group I intron endonuclease